METKITYGRFDDRANYLDWVSGTNPIVTLKIEIEDDVRTVYVDHTALVGAGTPAFAFHRHGTTLHFSTCTSVSHLERVLRDHEDQIVAWAEGYLGSRFNGQNIVGEWRESEEEYDLSLTWLQECIDNTPVMRSPSDWFEPLSALQIAGEICEYETLDKWAAHECDNAGDEGLLDAGDVSRWGRETIPRLIDEINEHLGYSRDEETTTQLNRWRDHLRALD